MSKRKQISKTIRFEVFKRDKFQCQYCGKSAPDVVLNIDHINPVAKGGDNEIINLITSCFDCNQGKKAKLLSDDTVIVKQRKQLELIQERREQLELMLEWKKSLQEFNSEKVQLVSDYWASMMKPYYLNELGIKSLKKLIDTFSVEDILEGIDIANKKYLKFNSEGIITQESVEEAFNKVGGICAIKNKPEVEQKAAYIKGIGRNRFSFWDAKKASIILCNYIQALRDYGWSELAILEDLETEVIPLTKDVKNWTVWKNSLEKWIDDIKHWEPYDKKTSHFPDFSEPDLNFKLEIIGDKIAALCYIGLAFPKFNKNEFKDFIKKDLQSYLEIQSDDHRDYALFPSICHSRTFFNVPEEEQDVIENIGLLFTLSELVDKLFDDIFNELNIEELKSTDYMIAELKELIINMEN